MPRFFMVLCVLVLTAGCSIPTHVPRPSTSLSEGAPTASQVPAGPPVTLQPGRAPSITGDHSAVRLDEVVRTGDRVRIGLTVASLGEETLADWATHFTTTDGQDIPCSFEAQTIPAGSQAEVAFTLEVPNRDVNALRLDALFLQGTPIEFPIPRADGAFVWRPAPLRQVGLPAILVRTPTLQFIPETLRSEGLMTELTFRAQSLGPTTKIYPAVHLGLETNLLESDGTTHPLLEASRLSNDGPERVTGTLRFLGELDPAATALTLRTSLDADGRQQSTPLVLPTHVDSPTVMMPGSVQRPVGRRAPLTRTDPASGANITVTDVAVLDDQTQVRMTVEGGQRTVDLRQWLPGKTSVLVEPDGTQHPLAGPNGADLFVENGETIAATLVFRGSIPTGVTSLNAKIGMSSWWGDDSTVLSTVLPIPGGETQAPAAPSTLGQVEHLRPAAAPTVRGKPELALSARPVGLALSVTPLPKSAVQTQPALASSARGTRDKETSRAPAQREAEAQRSLKDLGAQRTPQGYVLSLPETVLFDYDRSDIRPAAAATLQKVGRLLAYYDKAKVRVQGHTDTDGGELDNVQLSKRRAGAVMARLTSLGIPGNRMIAEGFGEAQPIAPNDTEANRAKNRRVTIVLNEAA